MTYIMQRNYGYTVRGIVGYGLNRFLRIYPMYWVACLVAIAVLASLDPAATTGINKSFSMPGAPAEWFRNLGLVLNIATSPVLISPAWALTVELFFYACIGLGLSRFRFSTLLWFLLSAAYTAFMVITDASWGQRYYSVGAASLPFATGALIYHWREKFAAYFSFAVTNQWAPVILLALIVGNWALSVHWGTEELWGFYVNWVLCSAMIVALFRQTQLPFVSRRLDSWLGNLSYPVYLLHFPLGFALLYLYRKWGLNVPGPGAAMFLLSVVPVLVLAWVMSVMVELPVERIRARVKQSV